MKKKLEGFLKQGLAPEKLALCVALGCVIGVIPVLGCTTLLCALTAWALRLNQPAIQVVNYLVYPLQVIGLIPFYRLGERFFRAPRLPLTREGVQVLIRSGALNAIHVLWDTTLRALAVWGLLAPVAGAVLYVALLPVFRRMNRSLLVQ